MYTFLSVNNLTSQAGCYDTQYIKTGLNFYYIHKDYIQKEYMLYCT